MNVEDEWEISYKLVDPRYSISPKKMTDGSVGYDLACTVMFTPNMYRDGVWPLHLYNAEREAVLLPLGVCFAIPKGLEGHLRPRSSHRLWLYDGTIDCDYRGEVVIQAHVSRLRSVMPGERIAQIVFNYNPRTKLRETQDLGETERGTGGFGSSGRF